MYTYCLYMYTYTHALVSLYSSLHVFTTMCVGVSVCVCVYSLLKPRARVKVERQQIMSTIFNSIIIICECFIKLQTQYSWTSVPSGLTD